MTEAQLIAEQHLGQVRWLTDTHGQCKCPGEHLHNKVTKPTDCEVFVDEHAYIHCFHGSCEDERETASQWLRMQLENAGIRQSGTKSRRREREKKARFEPEKLAALELDLDREWLVGESPIDPLEVPTPDDFLSLLYPRREPILVFVHENENQGTALWPRERFNGAAPGGVWFLPQPVTGKWVDNPRTGKRTRRSAECVTEFRYLVVESDEAPERQWLSYLVRLQEKIAAIYTSGGRSIHALIHVGATSKEQWDSLTLDLRMDLITHGADPKSLTSVRLTRLPKCWRGKEEQALLYLNPQPRRESICAL